MNIQEAIKSGKPFKRKEWDNYDWLFVNPQGNICVWGEDQGEWNPLDAEDILATDWEVKA